MQLTYRHVCLEAFAHTLPEQVVTSAEIEARLAPLYERLRLPAGRLELMTGIRERRFWPPGTLPGEMSAATAARLLAASELERRHVGALIHGSVCRDYLEPATAAGVHQRLGLPSSCLLYDVSNACLGLLNGMVQVANMIELGQIRAGIVVGTESGRALVDGTIAELNGDFSLHRRDTKRAFGSLTIGSGSAAVLLVHREISRTGNRLLGGVVRARTAQNHLCRSRLDASIGGPEGPLMDTDSETLMHEGIQAAEDSFAEFLDLLDWPGDAIDKTFCHQVGKAHRKLLLETLDLRDGGDFSTLEFLGNTGAVALPMTASLGIAAGHLVPNDRVALLGIGSGINVIMLAVDWQRSLVGDAAASRGRRETGPRGGEDGRERRGVAGVAG